MAGTTIFVMDSRSHSAPFGVSGRQHSYKSVNTKIVNGDRKPRLEFTMIKFAQHMNPEEAMTR